MTNEQLIELSKQLTKRGKLIEAGWIGLRRASINPDASQVQLDEMRSAFFAGAQHLFGSIMSMLDPGDEPTDDDLDRMTLIGNELAEFLADYKTRHLLNGIQGSA